MGILVQETATCCLPGRHCGQWQLSGVRGTPSSPASQQAQQAQRTLLAPRLVERFILVDLLEGAQALHGGGEVWQQQTQLAGGGVCVCVWDRRAHMRNKCAGHDRGARWWWQASEAPQRCATVAPVGRSFPQLSPHRRAVHTQLDKHVCWQYTSPAARTSLCPPVSDTPAALRYIAKLTKKHTHLRAVLLQLRDARPQLLLYLCSGWRAHMPTCLSQGAGEWSSLPPGNLSSGTSRHVAHGASRLASSSPPAPLPAPRTAPVEGGEPVPAASRAAHAPPRCAACRWPVGCGGAGGASVWISGAGGERQGQGWVGGWVGCGWWGRERICD